MSPKSLRSSSEDDVTIKASDERTPLLTPVAPIPTSAEPLVANSAVATNENSGDEDEDVPLPLAQIFLLAFTRMVEPIVFFGIFPYINSMIEEVGGIDVRDVGFYSGMIESLFSLVQMCLMIPWGRASDRFGRRPCLVVSLWGITVCAALFGMSTSIAQMVFFRCLAGSFAGTLVTIRAMVSENSTKKTQARAFSYFAFAGNMGIFIGPLLGGTLERPALKFPSTFGRIQFFHDYPYAFPGFITASVGLIAAILTTFFVKETLHLKPHQAGQARMSAWNLVKSPGVGRVIFIYNYILLAAFAFTAVLPVFLHTPINLGGIGFNPVHIAATLSVNGVSQAFWLLVPFPLLQRGIGTGGVLRICAAAWPIFMAVHPLCNTFLRHGWKVAFWCVGPISLVVGSGVAMSFTASQLAINDIAPTHETLGTLNAVTLTLSCALRAFIPALATSLYAIGVNYQIANGQFFWILGIGIAASMVGVVRLLPAKAEGKPQTQQNGAA
ncbi:MFS general substrate transporter [Lophiostoma macrostomum CBS 122681]|uniref:MFS general substrate transporter n=1 Tax=Lophiostoma macrostomum CBS 122681 TaxID=1314788 RepID=A0A6A6SPH3_9PLEO|nr:MFS general substrate transporter [Lophiostoma macrostomum CBS 122681]